MKVNNIRNLILVIILLLILSCRNSQTIEISKTTFDEMMAILDKNIENEKEQLLFDSEELEEKFGEFGNHKYTPILKVTRSILSQHHEFNKLIKSFYLEIEQDKKILYNRRSRILDTLQDFIASQDTFFLRRFESLLTEEYETFGFTKLELNAYLENQRKDFLEIIYNDKIEISKEIKDDDVFKLKLNLFEQIAVKHQRYFENRFLNFTRGRTLCGFNFLFPVLQPKKGCVNLGDYFEANISIGSYSSGYNPATTKVIINGDTLKMEERGTVFYKIRTRKRGEMTLHMECVVENPMTGEVTNGLSEYSFIVN